MASSVAESVPLLTPYNALRDIVHVLKRMSDPNRGTSDEAVRNIAVEVADLIARVSEFEALTDDLSPAYRALQDVLPILKRLAEFGSKCRTLEEENKMGADLSEVFSKLPVYENVRPGRIPTAREALQEMLSVWTQIYRHHQDTDSYGYNLVTLGPQFRELTMRFHLFDLVSDGSPVEKHAVREILDVFKLLNNLSTSPLPPPPEEWAAQRRKMSMLLLQIPIMRTILIGKCTTLEALGDVLIVLNQYADFARSRGIQDTLDAAFALVQITPKIPYYEYLMTDQSQYGQLLRDALPIVKSLTCEGGHPKTPAEIEEAERKLAELAVKIRNVDMSVFSTLDNGTETDAPVAGQEDLMEHEPTPVATIDAAVESPSPSGGKSQ